MGKPSGKVRQRGQVDRDRDKNYFKIFVKLIPTGEVFTLTQVHHDLKISELKEYLEFASGLPTNIQRLSYLDEGDLLNESDVRTNDIVPGATLQLRVWPMWTTLVEAVAQNDIEQVMQLGVTNPSSYHSPNSDYMTKRARNTWLEERAAVALFMAANRGLDKMCSKLVNSGADINARSPNGRTALHIASSQGHGHIVDLLLEKGADIDAEDNHGETALSIAEHFGFKSCGRHLFLFHWQQRAKKVTPARNIPLMAHQKNDSLRPVWKHGQMGQIYLAQQLGPSEFAGTSLSAPRHSVHPSVRHKLERDKMFFTHVEEESRHESEEDDYFPDDIKVLPPIKDVKLNVSNHLAKKGKTMKRPDTFEEWLKKRKDSEEKIKEGKKKLREEEKQKKIDEEEKRKEESDRMGYEKWLAQRQQEKAERASRHVSVTPRSHRDYSHLKEEEWGEDEDQRTSDEPGALRTYLRSLGRSRTGVPFEDWLNAKEQEIMKMPASMYKQTKIS
ncbi:ankyrin repeat domain-containing protein 35-like isoform X1 [Pomacea canaliculata]|uniref:ankyrin repeat domain-containing protein 35-like isoform X1 n=1 Tax=Pomacea canaliculata TaxID=400727 RepID=UPI000D72CB21|nr:ankyrin repeat domain-containing protein 35-like isoform X1 [Pomacea canaliculata]